MRFLGSLSGVAYVCDADGRLLAYNRVAWQRAALQGGAPELADDATLQDCRIYDCICDDETRRVYRRLVEQLLGRKEDCARFFFRNDSPTCRREMLMTMTCIELGHRARGVLYQSVEISSIPRPALGLLRMRTVDDAYTALPLLRMCSYCENVSLGDGGPMSHWLSPKAYYRAGGAEAVRLTHGICPPCYRRVVRSQRPAAG